MMAIEINEAASYCKPPAAVAGLMERLKRDVNPVVEC
jgi:hypothetical protein